LSQWNLLLKKLLELILKEQLVVEGIRESGDQHVVAKWFRI
jgi:hypothetical protein